MKNKAREYRTAVFLGISLFSIFLLCGNLQADMPFSRLLGGGTQKGAAAKKEQEIPILARKPMALAGAKKEIPYKVADASVPLAAPESVSAVPAPVLLEENDESFLTEPAKSLPVFPDSSPVIKTVSAESSAAAFRQDLMTADFLSNNEGGESLEEAWAAALTASRELSAKDYERLGADAAVRAARGVGLPKVTNLTGVHTVSETLAIQTDLPLSQISPLLPDVQIETPIADKDFATSTTALTVPIFMGGRVVNMIEAAQAGSSAIACGRKISEQDLKFEVAKTYFLVLRVRQLYNVALEAERTIAEHEKDAQRLLDNGIVTSNVLLAAQVAHANASQDLIKASNAVNLSQAAYNRLLWRQFDAPVQIVDMTIPPLSGNLDWLTEQAVATRSELTALAYKSQALAAKSRVKRADRLPQVAAVGTYNYFENSHLNENSVFTGSLGVEWTPFDGGVSRNQESASAFEAMSVTREYEEAVSKIRLQVYQCWQDEQETRHRVEVAEKAVEQASENLRVVTRGFKEGMTNHTEVLDAQTLRTQAMSNLANARYDAILATYYLRRAVGNL